MDEKSERPGGQAGAPIHADQQHGEYERNHITADGARKPASEDGGGPVLSRDAYSDLPTQLACLAPGLWLLDLGDLTCVMDTATLLRRWRAGEFLCACGRCDGRPPL
ncbi:MAG TPA: hypothetical protein VNX86_03880 [Rhizomicrobium sp.]|jgi:hypothetical protein|nr:hypothetical protein [Rhizomicrobium sp.]